APVAPLAPPTPPAPSPAAAHWLWTLTAAGAAAAFAFAFALTRRRRAGDEGLALAAHELKSPLAAIEAYLALMEEDGRSGAADTRAWLEDVANMRTTAAHLRRTIGDMLEMTRLEDGRLRLEARAFDLTALARDCARAYAALAARDALSVRVEGGPAPAWGDPDRVRQILDNLVGNALRHAPAGGTVTVRCSGGARARAAVCDDGPGVPPERRERLFQRFARLSEPARGGPGTGLGLYIGRRLAEASGGTLEHAPGPGGRGAVFTLTLPGGPA
ncbi:MAG: HAMP domain-containing sensor histidine kinase, partial [Elusimicrobiota bacterium]|nr:HAMP domain-containing sensor histidine kinase [Elusimicrobiota bacterium]